MNGSIAWFGSSNGSDSFLWKETWLEWTMKLVCQVCQFPLLLYFILGMKNQTGTVYHLLMIFV